MNIKNLLISDDNGDDNDDDEYESQPLTGNQLILKLDEADGISLNRYNLFNLIFYNIKQKC